MKKYLTKLAASFSAALIIVGVGAAVCAVYALLIYLVGAPIFWGCVAAVTAIAFWMIRND